jgi:hypothetical protein
MRRLFFVAVLSFVVVLANSFVAAAADTPARPAGSATPIADSIDSAAQVQAQLTQGFTTMPRGPKRPAALVGLYASFAALQIADGVSTFSALNAGGVEANPTMKALTKNRAAFFAFKAGASLATVYMTERLWKKNRKAAIVSMIVLNSVYATIVANNAKIARAN